MNPLPPKPPESQIHERPVADGVHLYWKPADAQSLGQKIIILMFFLAWLGGWAVGEVAVARTLFHSHSLEGMNAVGTIFMAVWLAGWTLGGMMAMLFTLLIAMPQTSESVTILTNRFMYRPGNVTRMRKRGTPAVPRIPLRERRLMRGRIDLERSGIIELGFEEIDGETRLFITDRTGRTQIGQYFEPPDREWLYVVLEEWRQG